ncbi:MAG: RimK family alpha-L-glutamate ligase [Pirellulaceae bacterium]
MSSHRRLGILASSDSSYAQAICVAAKNANMDAEVLSFAELATSLDSRTPVCSQVHVKDRRLDEFDAVLVRTMPLGSLEQVIFRMDALQAAVDAGVLVVNSPKCLETCIDKWLTLHRLHQAGLPVPRTVACQTREQAMDAFQSMESDVVIKPIFGGEGRGMMRIADQDLAWRVFSTLQQNRSVVYLQQFHESVGYDVRILLVGDRAYSMRRQTAAGGWRTNVALGGVCEAYEPEQAEFDLARRARDSVARDSSEFSVVGVDLLPCHDGTIQVLEVNAVPGWKGLQSVTQVDMSAEVIRHVADACRSQSRG